MSKRTIIVGGSLEDAARRVSGAWHRAERGEAADPEDNVTFVSWSGLAAVMTDKRHEILRHLRSHPAPSLRALARERDETGLHADFDEIRTVIAV